jgi:acyl-CoA thioesterase FadM
MSAVDAVTTFEKTMKEYIKHSFDVTHQYRCIRELRQLAASANCALVHIDYSENYVCKPGREIQAAHFGLHQQVVIHQGIYYCGVSLSKCFAMAMLE